MEEPSLHGFILYFSLFVPVWWVWNQFTWYASHFDNDDLFFRFLMLCGIGGTLLLSRGTREIHAGSLESFVKAYLFLHLALIPAWVRAYRFVPEYRPYSRLKLIGIAFGILFWGASLFIPSVPQHLFLIAGTALQLLMPVFAWVTVEKMISVHYHHLQERHGLFVIILLGECLLALSQALAHGGWVQSAISLLILFGIWWIYFDWKYDPVNLKVTRYAFAFNYGHFLVYAGLGLVAAGIGMGESADSAGGVFVTMGSAIFLTALSAMNWASHREKTQWLRWMGLGAAGVLAASIFTGLFQPFGQIVFLGAVLLGLIGSEELMKKRI